MSYTEQTAAPHGGSNTITAFYDDRSEAESAIERLAAAGIPRSSIQIIADTTGTTTPIEEEKGFWAYLGELFLADDDRTTYAEGIRRGGYLVTVAGYPLDLHDAALDILDDEGSINLDERVKAWESEGWLRENSNGALAESYYDRGSGSASASTLDADDEEELRIGKRDVSNGRVKVRSYVTETPVSENVSFRNENVEVTRGTVDRPLTGRRRLR
ncbi:DUF2382 domain-containing protein [Pararhizobium qamdonense]|uniref:DUF2382 domain-containing protein n=1 Tax=Pararhizobium qamdonense TaxID=3031126 RepID=UPI0023E1E521|nr:DUF2382 domain-containing protein [Pararhizobium qamdonense]